MKRYLILGASGALFTIVLSLIFSDLFQSWELKTLDTRFLLRGSLPTHPDIIMVDVDDASSDVYGQWPWKRTVHADMVHLLKEEGVKVVVYDILFKHPGVAEDDAQLAQSTADAQNVMFPVAVEFSDSDRATEDLPALPGGIAVPEGMDFPIVNRAIVPMPALTDKVKALGHIATNRDRDGIIRRVPLFLRYRDQLLPSMSFRAVLDFLDVDLKAIAFNGNTLTLPQAKPPGESQAMDISIPIDRKGQMLINFAGTWRDTFKHASFAAALKAGGKGQGEDLTGKLILVSNALSGLDFKTIPFEKNFPGGGVHANIINTLLTRNFLWETSGTMNILVVLLVSLLIAIVFRDRFFWTKLGAVLGLIAVYGMLTVMFFNQGIVMPLVIPSLSVVFTALLVSTYQVRIERKQKEMLIHEKQDLEGKLLEVSKNLDAKDRQMEAIRKSLEELGREMAEKNQQSEISSEKIYQLEGKLETLSREKKDLQNELEVLEQKAHDLELHIFEPQELRDKDWEQLRRECHNVGIVTRNRSVLETFATLKQYAQVPSAVLILGESGTGKELFARAIHLLSNRRNQSFVAVNMAAIPRELVESELFGHVKGSFTGAVANKKGKFLEANRGSIFLDEIGEMPKDIQVKLLRVLQEKEVTPVGGQAASVEVRIVSATNKNLEDEIKAGEFREDLFFRLNTLTLNLLPLRERADDIPTLAHHFMDKYSKEYGKPISGISASAMTALQNHGWPGNVRELENVIQRGIALAKSEMIQVEDLGLDPQAAPAAGGEAPGTASIKSASAADPDGPILDALQENGFEINSAAQQLNVSRNTVASRFKGICFKRLVAHDLDFEKVLDAMVQNPAHRKVVQQRLQEYHDNLVKGAKAFSSPDEAVEDALRKAKNVPSEYHPAIEQLVRSCFSS